MIERAFEKDIKELVQISQIAFEAHLCQEAPLGVNGPEGYRDPDFLRAKLSTADCWKILLNEQIVGGAIVRLKESRHYHLHRIWIHPDFQRLGLGRAAMIELFQNYPDARRWTLDTPEWAQKNARFYESLGFKKTGMHPIESAGFSVVLYERRTPIS